MKSEKNMQVNGNLEHLKEKKLFLFDIDGTIALSEDVIDGTFELLDYIREIGGRAVYITNNSSKSTADYVEKFRRMHIPAISEDFVTAGSFTLSYLTEHHGDDLIYAMATKSYVDELRKNGLHVTEDYSEAVDVVLTAFDTELTYEKIETVCRILMDDKKERIWLATNADLRCPVSFGMIPDCGSICNMISAATDRKPVYLGKPAPGLVNYSMEITGFSKEETLVVGDRIYTDIACGENAGVETCLVLTGEAKAEDVEGAANRIDFCFPSVRELYEKIMLQS
ncbi:MAG: HAD-IIA family hydrolase [Lachnospiraceae bacterium]